mgnify:CR=1 FL=1
MRAEKKVAHGEETWEDEARDRNILVLLVNKSNIVCEK